MSFAVVSFPTNNDPSQRGASLNASSDDDPQVDAGVNQDSYLAKVDEPQEQDVLCGRTKIALHHPGNLQFRALVRQHKTTYATTPNSAKKAISRTIVAAVRQTGGRFLELDPSGSGQWAEISEAKAVEKTSQALREGQPKTLQKLRQVQDHVDATPPSSTKTNSTASTDNLNGRNTASSSSSSMPPPAATPTASKTSSQQRSPSSSPRGRSSSHSSNRNHGTSWAALSTDKALVEAHGGVLLDHDEPSMLPPSLSSQHRQSGQEQMTRSAPSNSSLTSTASRRRSAGASSSQDIYVSTGTLTDTSGNKSSSGMMNATFPPQQISMSLHQPRSYSESFYDPNIIQEQMMMRQSSLSSGVPRPHRNSLQSQNQQQQRIEHAHRSHSASAPSNYYPPPIPSPMKYQEKMSQLPSYPPYMAPPLAQVEPVQQRRSSSSSVASSSHTALDAAGLMPPPLAMKGTAMGSNLHVTMPPEMISLQYRNDSSHEDDIPVQPRPYHNQMQNSQEVWSRDQMLRQAALYTQQEMMSQSASEQENQFLRQQQQLILQQEQLYLLQQQQQQQQLDFNELMMSQAAASHGNGNHSTHNSRLGHPGVAYEDLQVDPIPLSHNQVLDALAVLEATGESFDQAPDQQGQQLQVDWAPDSRLVKRLDANVSCGDAGGDASPKPPISNMYAKYLQSAPSVALGGNSHAIEGFRVPFSGGNIGSLPSGQTVISVPVSTRDDLSLLGASSRSLMSMGLMSVRSKDDDFAMLGSNKSLMSLGLMSVAEGSTSFDDSNDFNHMSLDSFAMRNFIDINTPNASKLSVLEPLDPYTSGSIMSFGSSMAASMLRNVISRSTASMASMDPNESTSGGSDTKQKIPATLQVAYSETVTGPSSGKRAAVVTGSVQSDRRNSTRGLDLRKVFALSKFHRKPSNIDMEHQAPQNHLTLPHRQPHQHQQHQVQQQSTQGSLGSGGSSGNDKHYSQFSLMSDLDSNVSVLSGLSINEAELSCPPHPGTNVAFSTITAPPLMTTSTMSIATRYATNNLLGLEEAEENDADSTIFDD